MDISQLIQLNLMNSDFSFISANLLQNGQKALNDYETNLVKIFKGELSTGLLAVPISFPEGNSIVYFKASDLYSLLNDNEIDQIDGDKLLDSDSVTTVTVDYDDVIQGIQNSIASQQAMNDSFAALRDADEGGNGFINNLNSLSNSSQFKDNAVYRQYISDVNRAVIYGGSSSDPVNAVITTAFGGFEQSVNQSADISTSIASTNLAYCTPFVYWFGFIPDIITWSFNTWCNACWATLQFPFKVLSLLIGGTIAACNAVAKWVDDVFLNPEVLSYQSGIRGELDYTSPLYSCPLSSIEQIKSYFAAVRFVLGFNDSMVLNSYLKYIDYINNGTIFELCTPGANYYIQYKNTSPSNELSSMEIRMFYRLKPMVTDFQGVGDLDIDKLTSCIMNNSGKVFNGQFYSSNDSTTYDKGQALDVANHIAGRCSLFYLVQVLKNYGRPAINWSYSTYAIGGYMSLLYSMNSSYLTPNDIGSRINLFTHFSNDYEIEPNGYPGIRTSYDATTRTYTIPHMDLWDANVHCFSNSHPVGSINIILTALIYFIEKPFGSLIQLTQVPQAALHLKNMSEYVSRANHFMFAVGIAAVAVLTVGAAIAINNAMLVQMSRASADLRLTSERYILGTATIDELKTSTKKARFWGVFNNNGGTNLPIYLRSSTDLSLDEIRKLIQG